jgi:hypothetical protein
LYPIQVRYRAALRPAFNDAKVMKIYIYTGICGFFFYINVV